MDLRRQFPTDHHCDQLAPVEIGRVARADQLPVPQNGDAIGDGVDLFQEVGDEDDAEPAFLEAAYDAEEHLHLVRVEACGRLVQNQDLAGKIHGPGDGHDLLNRHG